MYIYVCSIDLGVFVCFCVCSMCVIVYLCASRCVEVSKCNCKLCVRFPFFSGLCVRVCVCFLCVCVR